MRQVLPLFAAPVARPRTPVSERGRAHAAARTHKYGRQGPILASRAAALLGALATALHRRGLAARKLSGSYSWFRTARNERRYQQEHDKRKYSTSWNQGLRISPPGRGLPVRSLTILPPTRRNRIDPRAPTQPESSSNMPHFQRQHAIMHAIPPEGLTQEKLPRGWHCC
jgi:hypothetical protein